jgi:hypothetical protein
MAPDIASLLAAISFWEFWGYVALAAVVIGVIGESIEEFTEWPKVMGVEKPLTRISALILIAGLAGEGITQPNTNAANAKLVAFANRQTAELSLDLEKERSKTSARPWTKEQFDAIQDIKGVVTDVGILWANRCVECQMFGMDIEMALHSAGARIYGAHASEQTAASNTGIFVTLPVGSDLEKYPLVVALRKAGLNPLATHHIPEFSKIRVDIPVVFVGERFPIILSMPYQPPGSESWTILPIEK